VPLVPKPATGLPADEAPARKRGRPVGDREARSGELIAAARAVIARDGYAGATLRKVAEEAGATTGAVSYYFGNKEAMVSAVAEALFDEFDAWLEAQGGGVDPHSLCNDLLNWITSGAGEPWLTGLQLVVGARGDEALARVIERRNGQFMQNLTALLEKGQAEGVIRTDFPAEVLADQLGAMADGWALLFPIEPARFAPDRMRALANSAAAMLAPAKA
jgi:AcrR family transcriptional regulator